MCATLMEGYTALTGAASDAARRDIHPRLHNSDHTSINNISCEIHRVIVLLSIDTTSFPCRLMKASTYLLVRKNYVWINMNHMRKKYLNKENSATNKWNDVILCKIFYKNKNNLQIVLTISKFWGGRLRKICCFF